MEYVSLYSEARNEYMKQLCAWIVPSLVEFFRAEYNKLSATHGKKTMSVFQTFCAEVPKWNQDVIDKHINDVLDGCRCDYVEELMTAVFIAHTKMLTAIRTNSKQKNLQITLPKLDHFLHRVFTECARTLWKAPFLFATDLSAIERQKNVIQAESMCAEAMNTAVRSLLPVKNILREYLDDEGESESKRGGAGELDLLEAEELELPPKKNPLVIPSPTSVDIPLADTTDTAATVAAATEAAVTTTAVAETTTTAAATTVAAVAAETTTAVAATTVAATTVTEATAVTSEKEPDKSSKPKPPKQSLLLTKVDSPPGPPTPVGSDHAVNLPILSKAVTLEKTPDGVPTHLTIETEPAVHFTPYDTVFEDKTGQSTIEYAPKISVEDKPPSTWGLDDSNDLIIGDSSTSIGLEDVEDLDAGAGAATPPSAAKAAAVADIDAPLSSTGDFEELA
jgi:hypothetical protein